MYIYKIRQVCVSVFLCFCVFAMHAQSNGRIWTKLGMGVPDINREVIPRFQENRTPVAGENGQKPATATIYFKMVFLKESLLVALLLLIIHD